MSKIAIYALLWAGFMVTVEAVDPDTQTLNTVYEHWHSPDQLSSWAASSGQTACNMAGITCNSLARVVSLSLFNIPTGTFDQLLFTLTSLSRIALVRVGLIGFVPSQISQLTGLQMLRIVENYLSGSLPTSLSLLWRLTSIQFNNNQLTGSIPQQFSTLNLLRQLEIGNNRFTGSLPASLSSLTALINYYAPFNNFTGQIPVQYSALQQLTALYLSSNLLTNTIPEQLTSIRGLKLLLNNNPAMCGPALIYGCFSSTGICQDCPDPAHKSPAEIFGMVMAAIIGLVVGMVLSCIMQIKSNTGKCLRFAEDAADAVRIAASEARWAAAFQHVASPSNTHVQPRPVRQMELTPVRSGRHELSLLIPE